MSKWRIFVVETNFDCIFLWPLTQFSICSLILIRLVGEPANFQPIQKLIKQPKECWSFHLTKSERFLCPQIFKININIKCFNEVERIEHLHRNIGKKTSFKFFIDKVKYECAIRRPKPIKIEAVSNSMRFVCDLSQLGALCDQCFYINKVHRYGCSVECIWLRAEYFFNEQFMWSTEPSSLLPV